MKIKRFVGSDSRVVMKMVRDALGPDAVILSSKSVNGQMEMLAAIDLDALDNPVQPTHEPILEQAPSRSLANDQQITMLQQELSNLRGMLETELQRWKSSATNTKNQPREVTRNYLREIGISSKLADAVVSDIPENFNQELSLRMAKDLLAQQLPVSGDEILNDGGVVALVGSTGVGKTTTIAKLATRFAMRHGKRHIGIITTDCYRIGGQEQLETFASYLKIPVIVATTPSQLAAATDQFKNKKLVLVDTAGMGQRDPRLLEQYHLLKQNPKPIKPYVVLSATAQGGALKELISVFGSNTLAGAFVTKVDEAASLGSIIDLCIRSQLKLTYIGNGQRVPENLIPARSSDLLLLADELKKNYDNEEAKQKNLAG